MRPPLATLLHASEQAWLGCAALLVPPRRRSEWRKEWCAELWHVRAACTPLHGIDWSAERTVVAFCAGALDDALCLRRQQRNRPVPLATRAGSPVRCLTLLLGLIVCGYGMGLLLPGVRLAHWRSPYRDTSRLVLVQEAWSGDDDAPTMEVEQVRDWKRRSQTVFDRFAFYRVGHEAVSSEGHTAQNLGVAHASLSLFEVLGVPVRFAAPDEEAGTPPGVVLSDEVWKRQFAEDPQIAGRTIRVGGREVTVLGVAPGESWKLPSKVDAWLLEPEDDLGHAGPGFVVAHRSPSVEGGQSNERWPLSVTRSDGRSDDLLCIPLAARTHGPRGVFLFAVFLACLSLPALTSLPLGEYPRSTSPLPWSTRLRRWSFLSSKVALLLPMVYFISLDLAHLRPSFDPVSSVYIQLASTFSLCLIGLRWAVRDQRKRCPLCLGKLTHAARVGEPSRNFLGWNGVELICVQGHGLLHVPEIQTSWFSTQRWLYLDPTWRVLFVEVG